MRIFAAEKQIKTAKHMNIFANIIAERLNISAKNVDGTIALIDEGCTTPFIARYRKERTGGLDEVQISAISDQYERLKELQKRKETIVKTITEQGKMTPELEKRIADTWEATTLEDIYLPYRPKRRTRARHKNDQRYYPRAYIAQKVRSDTRHLNKAPHDENQRKGLYKFPRTWPHCRDQQAPHGMSGGFV